MPDAKKLFEALVREHADMLTVYLRSAVGNQTDVDDLFQETMVIAWRRLDDFDQTRAFGPWLRGIAKKLVLAHHRSAPRRVCVPLVLDQVEARLDQLTSRPGDTWDEKLDILRACVKSLPDAYRRALGLRYFKQNAIRQISHSMEITPEAVKKRLQRARGLVLDCVERKLAAREC